MKIVGSEYVRVKGTKFEFIPLCSNRVLLRNIQTQESTQLETKVVSELTKEDLINLVKENIFGEKLKTIKTSLRDDFGFTV